MIVLDASAAADIVLIRSSAGRIEAAMARGPVHVPAQFEAEVFVAIRRQLQQRLVDLDSALVALFALRRLRTERHLIADLLPEALMLRDRFGGHDVFYALLAKRLGATLVTADGSLALAAQGYVDVRYVPPG